MIDALPLLLGSDEYQISRSVRIRGSASAYFTRTLSASSTSTTVFTWSGWVKRGALGAARAVIAYHGNTAGSGNMLMIEFTSDTLRAIFDGGIATVLQTSAVYRDPSAWYHIVLAYDSTQATASNRVRLYVNGVQITAFSTANYPALNQAFNAGSGNVQNLGLLSANQFDGYLTEVNFIDGYPTGVTQGTWAAFWGTNCPLFGVTNAYGVWSPIKYNGTYGNNGFYLNFSDPSAATAAAIGKDYSGNGNNFTPVNISVTAGVTYDSMLDVPTPWADGGNGRGNYAVLNPLDSSSASNAISAGNLNTTITSNASLRGSIYVSTGKWYYEVTVNTLQNLYLGLASNAGRPTSYTTTSAFGVNNVGDFYEDNTLQTEDSIALAAGAVYGIAFDATAKKFWIAKDGQWYSCDRTPDITISASDIESGNFGYDFSTLTGDLFSPHFGNSTTAGAAVSVNFGQRPFAYTPPSGFLALNTQNLPTPTILKGNQYFDATTYTGNGTSQSIVNAGGMQPDLVWLKGRSAATGNALYDAVRGVLNYLGSESTAAESTIAGTVTAFNSNGFSIGSQAGTNTNAATYVGWQWKEGATQGFDIVLYTGNSTASRSINHSLGVTPSMIIVKNRSAVQNWPVAHTSLTVGNLLTLDTTGASTAAGTRLRLGNSTAFTVGDAADYGITNQTGQNYVAYCFAAIAGFSAFGSYIGNGSADGPFVFCGFRPRWIMTKLSSAAGAGWWIYDTARDTFNATNDMLLANLSSASTTGLPFDILSNGFKIRTSNVGANTSGATFIFAAFAESPFKYSLAR